MTKLKQITLFLNKYDGKNDIFKGICRYRNDMVIPQYCGSNTVPCMKYQNRSTLAWGLLIMAVWASLVYCISSCPLLKAQHYYSSLNECFSPPSACYQPLPPPTPINPIRDITETEKSYLKTSSI